ncbi:HXXEE domain-containing protein [Tahibacter sp.]|uniref:HXXEE domain-containing protein n=1 Tax=Tahibacter sp. TaxID=2056211 RepID=UPI0028C3F5A6|nr:HXXEE domain-containing protein [Tahibacter sp.]
MWLVRPAATSFERIKVPYWLTVAAFVLHKVEENRARFFETLSREVTGVAEPEATPLLFVAMLIVPAGAWLLAPSLMGRRHALGTYLAYTLFASMALGELAHFVFPLLTGHGYGYFPGMVTVFVLAPLGGWGLWRLWSSPASRSTGPAPG